MRPNLGALVAVAIGCFSWALSPLAYAATCAPVSSTVDGWTYVGHFFSTTIAPGDAWTSGTWSLDRINCANVGPLGNRTTEPGYCPRLEHFLQYRYDSRFTVGELLFQIQDASGNVSVMGYSDLMRSGVTVNSAFDLWARVNDTGNGDNAGTITVCVNR